MAKQTKARIVRISTETITEIALSLFKLKPENLTTGNNWDGTLIRAAIAQLGAEYSGDTLKWIYEDYFRVPDAYGKHSRSTKRLLYPLVYNHILTEIKHRFPLAEKWQYD